MLKLTIGGVQCTISLLFPAVLLYLLYLDQSGLASFGFLAAVLHECGHIGMILCLRERPEKLVISFFGMRMYLPSSLALRTYKRILISLAGPAVNILCAIILYLSGVDRLFVAVHFIMAALNLLPILPLDGGQALSDLLSLKLDEEKRECAMDVIFWLVWIPLTVLSFLLLWHKGNNITLLIVSLYLGIMKLFYKGN